jgi:hypothetical protein
MDKKIKKADKTEDDKFPLPIYDAKDDIYKKDKEESLDEEDDISDNDLDVPGAELDNADENIGEEDEENNYYSLGGDDHNDLEEDTNE